MMQQIRANPLLRPVDWMRCAAALALVVGLAGCANLPFGKAPEKGVDGGYQAGNRLALLLPTEGPLLGVADAVRDGVGAAARADQGLVRPKLVSVASGAPERVAQTLAQARDAGATHVIGPIDKPSVDALAVEGALAIPTLALNEAASAGRATHNLFQFSLSPETDAMEAARQAKSRGFTRALMLYPDDAAGRRRAEAFRRQWSRLGGSLEGELPFSPSPEADPPKVRELLARGADVVFLAANAGQARVFYPQIRADAAAVTVIATSDVYSGEPDPARDRALAGLYFVDMPWMLGVERPNDPLRRADLKTSASYLANPLGRRLYAMGIDAYRLAPRLQALAATPGASFDGQTGRLSVDALGRIRRELILARFTETGPEPASGIEAQRRAAQTRKPRPEPSTRGSA